MTLISKNKYWLQNTKLVLNSITVHYCIRNYGNLICFEFCSLRQKFKAQYVILIKRDGWITNYKHCKIPAFKNYFMIHIFWGTKQSKSFIIWHLGFFYLNSFFLISQFWCNLLYSSHFWNFSVLCWLGKKTSFLSDNVFLPL